MEVDVAGLPLLASGRDADVFALDAHRVLRRYRDGGDSEPEAAVMAYVRGLGFPAPAVLRARGRDLVLERLHGETMLAALMAGHLGPREAGAMRAGLHTALHRLPTQRSTDSRDRILHRDLHPDNVIRTAAGPVVIDWPNATEGPPERDGRCR